MIALIYSRKYRMEGGGVKNHLFHIPTRKIKILEKKI